MSRYTRQVRLVEVGQAGQARLESRPVGLATRGDSASIERAYLEGAGAVVRDAAPTEHALPFEVRDPAARAVALGAHAALAVLRRVWLDGEAP